MRRCMIYAVIGLFLLPLYGMAKKRSPKEERTNNHSALLPRIWTFRNQRICIPFF